MTQTSQSIVISGAGLVSGLGLTARQTWENVLAGHCAMRPMSAIESPLPPGREGGQALDLPADFAPELPREARYLKWTIAGALHDAGVKDAMPYAASRCACILGTTLHGMRAAGRFLRSGDYSQLRDFLAGSTMAHALNSFGVGGLAATTCSACSSSLGSIALAITLLETGQADLVIAGGYDTISEYVYGGFNSLRLVAEGPLRPFSKNRQGMKLAEGYGIVVLERADNAARRGVKPLAAIWGWGESADSHHLTQPHPQGDGAARAIEQAIASASLEKSRIGMIAAHATGTPDNDAGEYAAFARVFGDDLPRIDVTAFKSHLGHTLGGAGAVELILSAYALRDQVVPACANVKSDDLEFGDLSLVIEKPRKTSIQFTLNTSLGFGGANTCMILGPTPRPPRQRDESEVFITGVGVVFPGIIGNDAFASRLSSPREPAWMADTGAVAEADFQGLLNARRVRRMSDYVKLTLAAAALACRDAGIDDPAPFARSCAAVLGTTHGSSNYSETYYAQIVKEGIAAANPALFAEAVPNAGAAQLSLMLGVQGACQSVIGTRTAGLDALALAAARIRSGVWDRAIVGGGEEFSQLIAEAHRRCGVAALRGCAPFSAESGLTLGAGAVIFILESRRSMSSRSGRARARVGPSAAALGPPDRMATSIANVLDQLGRPQRILASACGTWIDRAEAAAMARCGVRVVSAIYGHIAETFSASPLAAIAAAALTGKMSALLGDGWKSPSDIAPARGDQTAGSLAAICSDFCGSASGICIDIL